MGQRIAEGKKDTDKDRAELFAELNALRDVNSRLKDVVKRYERVAGKKDSYRSLYDIEADKESVESLQIELQKKQAEIDIQGEELGVQNEELMAQLEEIHALNDVARMNAALRESSERLRVAQEVACIGTFEWNIQTGVNTWTPELEAMYGLQLGGFPGTEEAWEQLVYPEDRPEVVRRVNEAMEKGNYEGEWRVVWPDGTVHWLHGRAFVFKDESGKPLKLIGINIDITERKHLEEALKTSEKQLKSRLNAILSPGDIGEDTISDIIDIPALQDMADSFYSLTGVGISIDDLHGTILVGAGWQDMCTKFHRCHPETIKNCIESDLHLSGKVAEGEYALYKCKNGMWDIVTPIIVSSKHIANLFSGQFFFDDEVPDRDYFERQAAKYGFNKADYLAAMDRVPRHSRDKVREVMEFYTKFARLVSQLSYSNVQMARSLVEQKLAEEALRERTSELEKSNVELEAQVRERQCSETALRTSEEELLWANRALKAQSKCKEAMIRAEDEAVLLNDICHIIVDVGGYRLAWIGYVEDDELRTVRPVARAGYDEGYVDNLKIALNHPVYGSGPTGISLKSGKPYGSRNVQADGVMQPWRNDALKRGYHSTLNLPLMYEEQILGALVIYSGRPGAFENEELGLLIELADNIAFGIQAIRNRAWRDQAERELLRAKEELEVRVKERTEELRSAKEQAELYVDLMGHDINNLNHSAMGYLELALQELESEKKLRLDNKVLIEMPMKSLANSSALIDNVRKLKKLMTEGVTTKPTDLNKIFRELESTSFHLDERDVLINIQQVPGVMVSANELLEDAFVNLITNAIKHSDEEKPLTINVKVEPANQNGQKYYRCMVEDNGQGIPDEMKSKLFHRFQRGVTKAQGKGLGLYLVRTIVGGYNGKVWVEDRVPGDHTKGARFVVLLPIADN